MDLLVVVDPQELHITENTAYVVKLIAIVGWDTNTTRYSIIEMNEVQGSETLGMLPSRWSPSCAMSTQSCLWNLNC